MDTTKEYILMCEKAVEVQDVYEKYLDQGSFFLGLDEIYCIGETIGGIKEKAKDYMSKGDIWLPRQDQLQGMVDGEWYYKLRNLYGYFEQINWMYKSCKSMEQLWLAFVMKERYQKYWNGKDWVKK